MVLMRDFRFNQSNLQDFVTCKRRFFYRNVQNLSWPALETEPVLEKEEMLIRGAFFHKLVQQYYIGLPVELLTKQAEEESIISWWKNFLSSNPVKSPIMTHPEKIISITLDNNQLVAKYDLIALYEDESLVIFDWKTSRKKTKRDFLVKRLQTRIYPFILANSSEILYEGNRLEPENISMVYWFANYPNSPEIIAYSSRKMESDRDYLIQLIDEIKILETADQFPLTLDVNHCQYCVYRSLCDRGEVAGDIEDYAFDFESGEDLDIKLSYIEEIQF